MVGAGILAGDEDEVGGLEVGNGHRPLADADGRTERGARRFVAHVRAVGEVVGPEAACEQLVDEGGLVAGPPGGVEDGLVRGGHRGELVGDDAVGVVPAHRAVVGVAGGEIHRMRQPALLREPVAAAGGEILDAVGGEELGGHRALGGLLGDGLRAVLAELGVFAVTGGLRPGAAGTVESVALVEFDERLRGPHRAHLLESALERHGYRGHAGGPGLHMLAVDIGGLVDAGVAIGGVAHDVHLASPG